MEKQGEPVESAFGILKAVGGNPKAEHLGEGSRANKVGPASNIGKEGCQGSNAKGPQRLENGGKWRRWGRCGRGGSQETPHGVTAEGVNRVRGRM